MKSAEYPMNNHCERCGGQLIEIDHYGERLKGCPSCNRWQAATAEWCRLAPDDILVLRALKVSKREASNPQTNSYTLRGRPRLPEYI